MEHLKRFLSKFPPQTPYLLVLLLVFLAVFATNFPAKGEFLTGWDNLHPEFNIGLNLKRALIIWQSNEGLGLVGGHGYSATLPHTIAIFLLSLFFPIWSLRALFTFLMLFVGAAGAFFFTRHVLERNNFKHEFSIHAASLVSALFYMLSIGTVQNFYIQLEAFIVHFAFLPWLIITLFNLLERPNRLNISLFILANILILPAQFIPPLFIVEGIILMALIFSYYLKSRNAKRGLLALLIVFLINAYWFLPFSFYTLKYSKTYLNAYNNVQSTSEFVQKNLKYGGVKDVPLVRGFLFEANDIDINGDLFPILKPWIDHLKNPGILILGYSFFVVAIYGVIILLKKRNLEFSAVGTTLVFGIIFTLFATNIPPFSFVSAALRFISPLFEQAFRVTFTKFSISYVLFLAFFVGAGVGLILEKLRVKNAKFLLLAIFSVLLIVYALPSFRGNFLYKNIKLTIPQDYFSLFSYMKERPADERIMNLSQGWNWGWTLYNWGYTGSGFLWYGIQQPILDRAFDVWSPYNENYYWEIERALFSKDFQKVDSLLEKYQVSWVLFDTTVISYPGERQPIYQDAIGGYLASSHKFKLEKQFGNLKLFKVVLANKPKNDVLQYSTLPNVLPTYIWASNDQAADLTNTYYSDPSKNSDVYYPFRTIFTNRKVSEREFNLERSLSNFTFESTASASALGKPFVEDYSDPFVPARVKIEKLSDYSFKVNVSYMFPHVGVQSNSKESWTVEVPNYSQLNLNVNSDFFPLSVYGEFLPFDRTLNLATGKNNIFNFIADGESVNTNSLPPPSVPTSASTVTQKVVNVTVPATVGYLSYDSALDSGFIKRKDHDCFVALPTEQRLVNEEGSQSLYFSTAHEQKRCLDIILPNLSQETGYIVEIESKHVTGENLQFALVSLQPKKTEFQLSLPSDNKFKYSYIVIPAMQRDGIGYSLHFENDSTIIGESTNYLRSVRLTPIPYNYLTKLRIGDASKSEPLNDYGAKQIFPGVYQVNVSKQAKYLVLSQAFDKSWHAIGSGVGKHLFVNNWENGWEVKGAKQVYIVFLPEILIPIGFGLSISCIFLILKKRGNTL